MSAELKLEKGAIVSPEADRAIKRMEKGDLIGFLTFDFIHPALSPEGAVAVETKSKGLEKIGHADVIQNVIQMVALRMDQRPPGERITFLTKLLADIAGLIDLEVSVNLSVPPMETIMPKVDTDA